MLGTDVQNALGFCLLKKDSENSGLDVVSKRTVLLSTKTPCQTEEPPSSRDSRSKQSCPQQRPKPPPKSKTENPVESGPTPEVRLIRATKIPAGYQKMVPVRADGTRSEKLTLFTPLPLESNLSVPDCALDFSEGTSAVLIVQNKGEEAVCLKKGQVMGQIAPVTEATLRDLPQSEGDQVQGGAAVSQLTVGNTNKDQRKAHLFDQLNLQVDHLSLNERQQLKELIASYSDVFALDSSELGTTGLVKHDINTRDHPPIKQPVRRTPFALRSKMDELVKEMLSQGVVKPSQSPWASPVVLVKKKDGGIS